MVAPPVDARRPAMAPLRRNDGCPHPSPQHLPYSHFLKKFAGRPAIDEKVTVLGLRSVKNTPILLKKLGIVELEECAWVLGFGIGSVGKISRDPS